MEIRTLTLHLVTVSFFPFSSILILQFICLCMVDILLLAIKHIVDSLKFWLQIGFLYLRYAADPKTLWTWFEPYIKDEEVLEVLTALSVLWYLELVIW